MQFSRCRCNCSYCNKRDCLSLVLWLTQLCYSTPRPLKVTPTVNMRCTASPRPWRRRDQIISWSDHPS
jgi:hypothetical protein